MKIGIDGTRGINKKAGIGRYTRNLAYEMARMDGTDAAFLFTAVRQKHAKDKEIKRLIGKRRYVFKSIPGEWKNALWGWPISIADIWLRGVDLWHAPSIWEAPLSTRRKLVATIHDLTPFLFSDLRGEKVSRNQQKRTIRVAKRADRLICISQSTADDLVKFVPEAKGKISIVPLGVEDRFCPLPYVKKEKIILTVGTVEPRKNLILLFRAFLALPMSLQKEYKIWVVGARGWRESSTLNVAEALGDKVEFLGYVNDQKLVEMYNHAEVFAFPSLYEGFGLPLLEAMACGLPIVANKISSVPEVVGDAAMLLRDDAESWSAGLARVLTDANLRSKMRLAGLRRVKQFTWQKMAQETVKIYQDVNNSSSGSSSL